MEKISKNYRILNMYQRLCSGKCLNKQEEAKQFGVDERSIQRDIDDIRAFLMEQTDNSGDSRQVVYDRSRKGYVLTGAEQALMSNDEILAVSKILLESRAFTKKEIKEILDKMILGCVPQKNRLNHKFCGISDSSRSSVGSYRIASERNIRHQDIRIPVCEES